MKTIAMGAKTGALSMLRGVVMVLVGIIVGITAIFQLIKYWLIRGLAICIRATKPDHYWKVKWNDLIHEIMHEDFLRSAKIYELQINFKEEES